MYKYYNYKAGKQNNIDYKIFFIEIIDLLEPVERIMEEILDYSWLSQYPAFKQSGLKVNMLRTIPDLISELDLFLLNSNNGEIFVSYIGKHSLMDILNHDGSIPIGEIYKPARRQNGGFDFFTQSKNDLLFFGEAKFQSTGNSHNSALKQINDFIDDNKDKTDSVEIMEMLKTPVMHRFQNDEKGFCAAFTIEQKNIQGTFDLIISNPHFKNLLSKNINEIICVGVCFNV